jgi:AraC-like DNA-binding protein
MACHMSGSRFSRTFKKEHGISFRRYLLRYRLERACEFLASAETSVKQAALAAGFNDCSYFDRVFRRRYGSAITRASTRHLAWKRRLAVVAGRRTRNALSTAE